MPNESKVAWPVAEFERNEHDAGMTMGHPLWKLPPGKYLVFKEGEHPIATPEVEGRPVTEFTKEEIPFLERADGLLRSHFRESIYPTIEKIRALLPPEE